MQDTSGTHKQTLEQSATERNELVARLSIRDVSINDRSIFIIDNVLVGDQIHAICQEVMSLPFHFGELDFKGDEYPISAHELDTNRSAQISTLTQSVTALLGMQFPDLTHRLERAYVNQVRYGDMTYPHTDASGKSRNVTAIFYANDSWNRQFGGETNFYDYRGENLCAVLPRPGRVVLFHGSIEHNGSPPTRITTLPRYTVVFKFDSR
jgi:SM-20-related protein